MLDNRSPFVMFRPPEALFVSCLHESPGKEQAESIWEFLFAPFDRSASTLSIKGPVGFKANWTSLAEATTFDPVRLEQPADEKAAYTRHVATIQDAIGAGEVSKVVLSRAIGLPVQRDAWSVFVRLLSRYKNAYCYWWYHPDSGHWMGATPEVLLSAADGDVEIMSLAGTLAATSPDDVDWSDKERDEQAVVTDYIEEILNTFGGPVQKEGPVSVQAGNLLHLRTLLRAHITVDLKELIDRLHPTPAVCGLPAKSASRLIAQLEPHDREYYTGYLGIRSDEPGLTTELYVNLRCMKWSETGITLFVGGGITEGSDPEKEWQETLDKSRTLLDILDITLD